MRRYRCHKEVEAAKIVSVALNPFEQLYGSRHLHLDDGSKVEVDFNFCAKHKPEPGDVLVRYVDGYLSISPAKAFEDGYTLI